MPTAKSKPRSRLAAWWLSSGEEECPHCGQVYAYEIEFRCPDCDGPSCPHCKQRHSAGRFVCPGCVEGCTTGEGSAHG